MNGKRWLPWTLLALSVGFNGFFLAGWWLENQRESSLVPERRLARKLLLDDSQRQRLRQIRADLRGQRQEIKRRLRELEAAFWQELGRSRPDRKRLEQLLVRSSRLKLRFQRRGLERLLGFLEDLTPEQKRRFLKLARQRIARGLGFPIQPKRTSR